jgi:L-threonylcarbamoyladenylate synthase
MIKKDEIELIKNILDNDGVIALPTDTVWGLACLLEKIEAVKEIYELKNRDGQKPLILMSSDIKYLIPYIKEVDPFLEKIFDKYFPGQLTVIVEKSDLTPDFVTSGMSTVGIRVPDHAVFVEVAEKCSGTKVLATTSANISSFSASINKQQVQNYFGDKIDYIVDDFGLDPQNMASTIIKIEDNNFKILRQGSIIVERDRLWPN